MNSNHPPALVIIDVQQGFEDDVWGKRNNPNAEERIRHLLQLWRTLQWPVIHIQHVSTNPYSPLSPNGRGVLFKEIVKPLDGEKVIQKNVNSAFIGTDLESYLKQHNIADVVIVGLTTPHCVSTTVRMSGNLGFNTYVISDATAAFGLRGPDGIYYDADQIHNISLATLHGEFATVLTAEELIKQFIGQ
ncbi:cysteine hydrolase family protein [Anoxybacteroides tepidamans]|uniref:cysteine hydrolase family protein n=1 Tax=Anoxybacteroides tepidamans TaxID=265948 RepID=UPI0004882E49|nr:cysteine hydrolase family protein [Anoxybacillus tepidamans]